MNLLSTFLRLTQLRKRWKHQGNYSSGGIGTFLILLPRQPLTRAPQSGIPNFFGHACGCTHISTAGIARHPATATSGRPLLPTALVVLVPNVCSSINTTIYCEPPLSNCERSNRGSKRCLHGYRFQPYLGAVGCIIMIVKPPMAYNYVYGPASITKVVVVCTWLQSLFSYWIGYISGEHEIIFWPVATCHQYYESLTYISSVITCYNHHVEDYKACV